MFKANLMKNYMSKSIRQLSNTFRMFSTAHREVDDHLRKLGLNTKTIVRNPSIAELYEYALLPKLKSNVDPQILETHLSSTGALVNYSGPRTGRSPKDKRTVIDDITKDRVWWGDINMPIPPASYKLNRQRAIDYLNSRPYIFIIDGYAGWDKRYRKNVRIVCNRPYHAIFMKQMLIRPTSDEIVKDFKNGPHVTIINAGEFFADPQIEGVGSRTCPAVDYTNNEMVILGTHYAGEMKKGMFGVMHYIMPLEGVLSMHASANEGPKGDVTLLFGLSGTGKTTLSADPHRQLIGDDEHCWTADGVFNIEGGCYAKCINLSEETEPEIYHSIRYGAILENVRFFPDQPGVVNYTDKTITENTRCAYPLEHMPNVKIPAVGGHPKNIIFLTCDANGVLPPVAKLDPDQIMYHFISGYTAKTAGTEVGITDPEATFSACFGAAFLPLHPFTYAKMLADKVKKHDANVWLINSGWSGGKFGVGKRMSLKVTRQILDSIHDGSLSQMEYKKMDVFNLQVPTQCPGVESNILMPRNTWLDKKDYDLTLRKLASQFIKNFKNFEDGVPKSVVVNGGPTLPEH